MGTRYSTKNKIIKRSGNSRHYNLKSQEKKLKKKIKETKSNLEFNHEELSSYILNLYEDNIRKGKDRFVKMCFLGKQYSTNLEIQYALQIAILNWLANKDNQKHLKKIVANRMKELYGDNALSNFGISKRLSIQNLFDTTKLRNFEKHFLCYSDNYLNAIKNSPKIPIQDWQVVLSSRDRVCKSKKVLFNINGEILLGEFIQETTKEESVVKNANSSIGFFVYYRGIKDAKFVVERWDYEPLSIHKNKFDENGVLAIQGSTVKNTKHSHRHIYTLNQRLIFGKNFSADICPTPINEGNDGEELRYESFDKMKQSFYSYYNLEREIPFNYLEMAQGKLLDLGLKYCPRYDSIDEKIVRNKKVNINPVNRLSQVKFAREDSVETILKKLDSCEEVKVNTPSDYEFYKSQVLQSMYNKEKKEEEIEPKL